MRNISNTTGGANLRWIVLVVVMVVTLAVAAVPVDRDTPRTPAERVSSLASQIRCPTCAGLSVAQSDAPLARSSLDEITAQVSAGKPDNEIKAYFVSRYGDTALLNPSRSGIYRVVWVLPVLLGAALLVLLVMVTRRWRAARFVDVRTPDDDDRQLVEAALRARR